MGGVTGSVPCHPSLSNALLSIIQSGRIIQIPTEYQNVMRPWQTATERCSLNHSHYIARKMSSCTTDYVGTSFTQNVQLHNNFEYNQ